MRSADEAETGINSSDSGEKLREEVDKEGGDKLHWSKFPPQSFVKIPGKTVSHNSIRAAAESMLLPFRIYLL